MLDQNTDRMWYVIGAVIVGAAIIFILNGTMPELFASVGGMFESKADTVTEEVDGISPVGKNILRPEYLTFMDADNVVYDDDTYMWTFDVTPSGDVSDIRRIARNMSGRIKVPYGTTYTISYEIYTPVDLSIRNDVRAIPQVDGEDVTGWLGNNNDDVIKRRVNGSVSSSDTEFIPGIAAKAGQWTTIWHSYTNTSIHNIDELDLRDETDIGFFNDSAHGVISMKLRNLKGEFGTYPTQFVPVMDSKLKQ